MLSGGPTAIKTNQNQYRHPAERLRRSEKARRVLHSFGVSLLSLPIIKIGRHGRNYNGLEQRRASLLFEAERPDNIFPSVQPC